MKKAYKAWVYVSSFQTAFGMLDDMGKGFQETVKKECEKGLRRLGLNPIDLLYCGTIEEITEAIRNTKKRTDE